VTTNTPPTLNTINEDPSLELAKFSQLPQSTPHPKQQNVQINKHLLDQLSISFQVDPEVHNDGEDTEFKFPDDSSLGSFVEGKQDKRDELDDSKPYEDEDDTFTPTPVELPVQVPTTTKPKGRGHLKKAVAAPKKARSKHAVSKSDEDVKESSEDVKSSESVFVYLCILETYMYAHSLL
jgi:hypothetical protein